MVATVLNRSRHAPRNRRGTLCFDTGKAKNSAPIDISEAALVAGLIRSGWVKRYFSQQISYVNSEIFEVFNLTIDCLSPD